jgi:hypothetical protein
MKTTTFCLLLILLGAPLFAETGFYTEAGLGYVVLRGAHYRDDAPSLVSIAIYPPILEWHRSSAVDDKSTGAPFVALGYSFNDRLGVRLTYQYIADLTARSEWRSTLSPGYETLVGVLAPYLSICRSDDIHVLSVAPELAWPVTRSCRVTFSPELNWVASRGEVVRSLVTYYTPDVSRQVRNEQQFTLGGSVGLLFDLTEKVALSVGYKYADLKPSWDREAHILSGSIRLRF